MGHTKLFFGKKWWPAIYGCGGVREYVQLCFADSICSFYDLCDDFEALLNYVGKMSEILDGGGWDGLTRSEISLVKPPIEHWNNTVRWMESREWTLLPNHIKSVLMDKNEPIECIHFVCSEQKIAPLFCPSILSDYIAAILKSTSDWDQDNSIFQALLKNVATIYPDSKNFDSRIIFLPYVEFGGEEVDCESVLFVLFDKSMNFIVFCNGGINLDFKKINKRLFKSDSFEIRLVSKHTLNGTARCISFNSSNVRSINFIGVINDICPQGPNVYPDLDFNYVCGASDILSVIYASDNIDECVEFLYAICTKKINPMDDFAGIFPTFSFWKDEHHNILPGAEDLNSLVNICSDYEENDEYYSRFFNLDIINVPFINHVFPFGSPFSFKLCPQNSGFTLIYSKSNNCIRCYSKRLMNSECYVAFSVDNASFINSLDCELEKTNAVFNSLIDGLIHLFNDIEEELIPLVKLSGGLVEFIYSRSLGTNAVCVNKDLGMYIDCVFDQYKKIFYSINPELFIESIMGCMDRSVECVIALNLLSFFPDEELQGVFSKINFLKNGKKRMDVKPLEIPYIWHRNPYFVEESDISIKAANKLVAYAASTIGVSTGVYEGISANQVLRTFQYKLVEFFSQELKKYSKDVLILELYETAANSLHSFYMETKRFDSCNSLEDYEFNETRNSSVELREDCRRENRAARYCLETILANRIKGEIIPTEHEIAYLISVAECCVLLNDMADIFYFSPKGISLIVEENSLINYQVDEDISKKMLLLKKRSLEDSGHWLTDTEIDRSYIKKFRDAFKKDQGFSFECLLEVLQYLAMDINQDYFKRPNVVSIVKGELLEALNEELGDVFTSKEVTDCFYYLLLDDESLMILNGKGLGYIPFGRVKDRPNRIDLKPLVSFGGDIIYSPVCCGMLRKRWVDGAYQRFLPIKIFNRINSVMSNWKKHYEKALEDDVKKCFLSCGIESKYVFKGLKLYKYGNHQNIWVITMALLMTKKERQFGVLNAKSMTRLKLLMTIFSYSNDGLVKMGILKNSIEG